MTRGTLCVKLKDFHDHHANPDRLMYPLRRTGPKGSKQFERISWDEAIAEIGRRWREIIATYGSQAIMPLFLSRQYGPGAGHQLRRPVLQSPRHDGEREDVLRVRLLDRVASDASARPAASTRRASCTRKFIVIWACNSISTNLHHWPFVLEAQKRGAKVVVIDTYRSRTAKAGDWHICPKPGTDGALAMGIINSIIEQGAGRSGLCRAAHVRLAGAEGARGRVHARLCREDHRRQSGRHRQVRQGVRHHAALRHSHRRGARAHGRRRAGDPRGLRAAGACRFLAARRRRHAAIAAVGLPRRLDEGCAARLDQARHARRSTICGSAQALTGEMKLDPPIKSLFVFCTNPVSQAPETNKIVEGLQREDLFTVVAEHFLTDTAKYADIVLPSAMAGEAEDMMWSWGHFYFTYNQKAIDPPGECKPTSDMWRMLAKEMGFDDPVFKMTDSELCRRTTSIGTTPRWAASTWSTSRSTATTRSTSARRIRARRTADGKFPTPSGKVEFLLHDAKNFVAGPFRAMYEGDQDGSPVDPLPGYVPIPRIARDQPGARQALSAQHHLAEEPRLPELVLRQREAQDQRPGRAVRADLAGRRRQAQHPRRRSGAGL